MLRICACQGINQPLFLYSYHHRGVLYEYSMVTIVGVSLMRAMCRPPHGSE